MSNFEDVDESEAELARELRTRGAWIAYRTSVAVCEDLKAPAAARTQAASNLFRAGGFFANADAPDDGKDPANMTPDELAAATRKALAYMTKKSEQDGLPLAPPAQSGNIFD